MNFIVAASTDIGLVKNTNQDSFLLKTLDTPIGKMAFGVLCDGMGGLEKGEVASASLVNAFNKWSETRLPLLCDEELLEQTIRKEWSDIAIEYNEKIKVYGKKCGVSMGTTLTAILLTQKKSFIINVGDTRAYEIREGVKILTNDHTVIAREIALGNLTEEQAKIDARRSILLQCVGASDVVYPDVFIEDIKQDAVYMLCTDGFRHEITDQEIYGYLNPSVMVDPQGMKQNMDSLIEINKQRQERDNITVLTIRTYETN